MDKRLQQSAFLGGAKYSIADMAVYPWLRSWQNQGIDWADYPKLKLWFDAIDQRPAVQRGVSVLASLRKPVHDDKSKEMLFGQTQYQKR
jgi:GST-like protein